MSVLRITRINANKSNYIVYGVKREYIHVTEVISV